MRGAYLCREIIRTVHTTGAITATTLDWIQKLISFDSTSRESNLALIETIRNELVAHGLNPTLVPNPDGTKANLFVTIPALDGTVTGGIMLAGHTDVVPVDGQDWSTDPFTAEVRDGRIYGRGTCDMKAFGAVILGMLPEFLASPLRIPLHLALTYDEEVGCHGAAVLLEYLTAKDIHPAVCIVGEPTSMLPVTAHKSSHLFRVSIQGVAAHSSNTPAGANAIEYAARAISFIRAIADENRTAGPFDSSFEVPFTTANVGVITGGVAVNTVADRCEFEFEFRTILGVDPTAISERIHGYLLGELRSELQRENAAADIRIAPLGAVPALGPGTGQALELVQSLIAPSTVSSEKTWQTVGYGTEGGLYQLAGIDTVVCGPGSMAQGHTANEYIELSQVRACEEFMRALARHCAVG